MNKQLVCKNLLISYSESGSKDSSSTIIFLHGWRSNKEVWNGIPEKLGNKEIRKYALDLPGFGQSELPKFDQPLDKLGTPQSMNINNGWGVGDYAEVVAEFIKKLDLKNIIIVGHSFGGRVGIKLSSEYSELVTKLVLVDSAGFAMNQNKKSAMVVAAKIAKPFFKPKFMQGLRKKIYQKIGSEDYVTTPELQKTYVNVIGEDLSQDMKNIKCPTLIINGENDIDTPVVFGEKMHSLIHNSKFIILPNSGHFSFLDQPQEFIKELIKFIKA